MKIIKYVFLLLLLATVAIAVFIATQEGKYDIKREKLIRVQKGTLFNYINDYRNWEHVGILTHSDSTAAFTYSDTTSGPGATMQWKSENVTGKVTTLKNVATDSIVQQAVIDGQGSAISWAFKDSLGATKVAVRIKGELSFTDKAYAVFKGGVQEKLEDNLEKGLQNLNQFLVTELGKYDVKVHGLVAKTAAYYVGFPVSGKIEDIGRKSADYYPKLMDFIKENKIVTAGAPFLLYKTFNEAQGTASYVVCMPVRDEIYTMAGSDITGGRIERFTALKATLTGDYSHLKKAWDAARREVAAKGHPENTAGQYLEVYTKGLPKVKRPSQWVTDIYIPIGQPETAPAPADVPLPPVSGSQAPVARPAERPQAGARPSAGTGSATSTGTARTRTPSQGTAPASGTRRSTAPATPTTTTTPRATPGQ